MRFKFFRALALVAIGIASSTALSATKESSPSRPIIKGLKLRCRPAADTQKCAKAYSRIVADFALVNSLTFKSRSAMLAREFGPSAEPKDLIKFITDRVVTIYIQTDAFMPGINARYDETTRSIFVPERFYTEGNPFMRFALLMHEARHDEDRFNHTACRSRSTRKVLQRETINLARFEETCDDASNGPYGIEAMTLASLVFDSSAKMTAFEREMSLQLAVRSFYRVSDDRALGDLLSEAFPPNVGESLLKPSDGNLEDWYLKIRAL
ncbi:MAG: hypothetical protein EOP06_01460 [Proteobacteria bacterium]|nr:MAG: hypothetical protein EOP06_01460 [Pseudomonadota bacterium]